MRLSEVDVVGFVLLILCAYCRVEARCCPNGIGLVKLMGRHAGFIAAHATLANRDVDLCLIPEIPLQLGGDKGRHGLILLVYRTGFHV